MSRAVVVGAGVAGLSAALRLADSGIETVVLERRRAAGGRVRRIDPGGGRPPLDCGQHLMLGCYRETLAYVKRIGPSDFISRIEGATPFVSGDARVHEYRLGRLPAPFHAVGAVAGLSHLGFRDRVKLGIAAISAKAVTGARRDALDRLSVRRWLEERRQGTKAISGFWEPLVLATLNTPVDEASALLFATVITKGFLAGREDATPILPRTTLHDLLVGPAVEALVSRGARIAFGQRVVGLEGDGSGGVAAVTTASGERVPGDAFVIAVPSWDVGALRGEGPWTRLAEASKALGSSPIITVNLWFDRPWLEYPMAGLVGGTMQWAFTPRARGPEGDRPGGHRVALVLSAADGWVRESNDALVARCLEECRRYFPASRAANLRSSLVLKCPRATFRARVGQGSIRAACASPFKNVRLAGDWTDTGLPATIEGAVQSGHRAAAEVVRHLVREDGSSGNRQSDT